MAKKHVKKMPIVPGHKGNMQNKATLRFHLTPVRIVTIKNTTMNKCWQGCGEKESSYTAAGGVR
jgi:hypothetical protein